MSSKSFKILALGDSYTVGESVEMALSFPNQVVQLLQKEGKQMSELKIVARTGWRTDNLKDAILLQNLYFDYDLVFLLIGVNNQFQKRNIQTYSIEFLDLLNQSIRFANGNNKRVFVLSIPDYGFTEFGIENQKEISTQIDLYNQINKELAEKKSVNYINITDISRSNQSNLLAIDKLHPSGFQYKMWSKKLFESICKVI